MSLESALKARFAGFTGLTDLVGTRIFAGLRLPQNPVMPAVSYGRISETPEHAMGVDSPLLHVHIQVSSWATTYDGVRLVATQVKAALDRWSTTTPIDGTTVQDTLRLDGSGQDLFEPDVSEDGLWQRVYDFMIHGTGF